MPTSSPASRRPRGAQTGARRRAPDRARARASRSPPGASPGADRIEADLFQERGYGADANPGLALIRDGNGTQSFETLLRYRGAAMAEFWRALRTLKALQAEQAAEAGVRHLKASP